MITAIVLSQFICNFDKFQGHVSLVAKETIQGQEVTFTSYLGKEDFENPFALRNACKKIAKTLNEKELKVKQVWEEWGCESYSALEQLSLVANVNGKSMTFRPSVSYDTPAKIKELVQRYEDSQRCDTY